VRLSVIIPTFNTAAMTLRCCRAVLETMPPDTEVIVADDASTDGTAALLPPEVRVVRLEVNRGFAGAANRGVEAASGDIILVLNSDAVVQPGALQAMLDAFEDPKLGIAGAQLLNEDGTEQWSGGPTPTLVWMIAVVSGLGRYRRALLGDRRHPRVSVDWVSGAAMAIRREAWTPFSEKFLFYCQDLKLCIDTRDAGWAVRIVPEARVVHLLGATIAGASKQKAELLWPDLLTWGRDRYGRVWGAFARVVLVLAALLRGPKFIRAAWRLATDRS